MADKARHAFGMLENIDSAISAGTIDAYDILFVKDANGKPYVGWIDKNGNKVVVDDSAEFAALESEIALKADANEVKAIGVELATKASAEDLQAVDAKVNSKADASEVNAKIETAISDSITSAKAYTNKVVEAAMEEHLTKKYEIADVPEGTLVNYREDEIRVMCPANATFVKQNVGTGGDKNNYYMTFKTYAPNDDAVGYIEHLGDQSDSEILADFSVDEFGRRYQPTWLAIAKYDESTDTWTYYGKNSNENKYIGWDYRIDWFNANNVMIASDSIRISLSNEDCHSSNEPYYIGTVKKEVETIVEEKIKEVEVSYEIIEF